MPTLNLNCQRQRDPLTSSSQVIAMQMRSSRDKLATARQWSCPLVCLMANRVMHLKKKKGRKKKRFPVINAAGVRYPGDLHREHLHWSSEGLLFPCIRRNIFQL